MQRNVETYNRRNKETQEMIKLIRVETKYTTLSTQLTKLGITLYQEKVADSYKTFNIKKNQKNKITHNYNALEADQET